MYYLTKNKPSFFRKNQSKVLLAFWIVLSLSGGGGDWRQPKGNYIIMLILGGHEKLLKGTL